MTIILSSVLLTVDIGVFAFNLTGIRRVSSLPRFSWSVATAQKRAAEKYSSMAAVHGHSPIVCTHDGIFHSDEALGCYLLKILHPHAKIVRSRDPAVHEESDIVLDVGNIYDAGRNRFDHHQQSFNETMSSLQSTIKSSIRLSSAGLIYHHFGRSALKILTGETTEAVLDYLYKQLYFCLIQEIDGVDNGIPQYESEPSYNICSHISTKVGRLNKPWNHEGSWDENAQFHKAMDLVAEEFNECIRMILKVKYPARKIVQHAIENRHSVHPSGEIIELRTSCPWKNHFFDIEQENRIDPRIKYVLFEGGDCYRVQCVSLTPESYVCRKFLPESWRGLRDVELSKKADIQDCIFVHSNGFIGGNKSRDGALQMAIKSLESID